MSASTAPGLGPEVAGGLVSLTGGVVSLAGGVVSLAGGAVSVTGAPVSLTGGDEVVTRFFFDRMVVGAALPLDPPHAPSASTPTRSTAVALANLTSIVPSRDPSAEHTQRLSATYRQHPEFGERPPRAREHAEGRRPPANQAVAGRAAAPAHSRLGLYW